MNRMRLLKVSLIVPTIGRGESKRQVNWNLSICLAAYWWRCCVRQVEKTKLSGTSSLQWVNFPFETAHGIYWMLNIHPSETNLLVAEQTKELSRVWNEFSAIIFNRLSNYTSHSYRALRSLFIEFVSFLLTLSTRLILEDHTNLVVER